MKLKNKMMVLFLTIILVPLIFAIAAFLGFGYHENIDILHELTKEDIMLGAIINKRFLSFLAIAMIVILILTSAIITMWVNNDIYRPIKELSYAMQRIA